MILRVLHVIPSIGPLRGGPSAAMGIMARALRDAGVSVDVATTNDNDTELLHVPIGTPVDEQGVRYWYFERTTYPYTSSAGLARWLAANVGQYDIVHTHALFSFSTSASYSAAQRSAIPYIVRPLGTLAHYGMQQHSLLKRMSWLMLERRIVANAAAIHCTSEAERADVNRLGKSRCVVVPLAVETLDLTQPLNPPADRLVFLFLSRIHPKKRVDMLLRAFAVVISQHAAARLIIAGSGDAAYTRQLQQLTAELQIGDRVEWAGHVSGVQKRELLSRAHAFVLPSINENFGIAAVEALAAGVPVVVTRGVAIHHEIENSAAGVIVEDDAAALAAGMLRLRDPITRSQMAANAQALVRDTFSVTAMQQGLLRMYEQVLAA